MADEILIFDATGSGLGGTDPGSPLSVGPGTSYGLLECSYPAAPLNVMYASSIDTEGELPVTSRYGNRTITIKMDMVDAAGTLLAALQAKFAKLQREGGTLKRTMKNGDVRIYDIVAADGWNPVYDFAYYLGDLAVVEMTLPAMPLSRGVPITLSTHTATAKAPLVFTETGIAGDAPGLGTLRLGNTTTQKSWAYWGLQSRNYSAAATAGVFFEAEDGTASAAALNAGPAGASGAGANKVMRHATVGTSGTIAYQVGASGSPMSHYGSFVALARVWADAANTGTVSSRLLWGRGVFASPITVPITTNQDWVPIEMPAGTPLKGQWVIVNLGMVSIPKVRLGSQQWTAEIWSKSTIAADIVSYDWVTLVPVGEGSGVMASGNINVAATGTVDISDAGVLIQNTNVYEPDSYEGRYMSVPPAGAEARTLRVVALLAGAIGGGFTNDLVQATNLEAITGTLTYTPRYLT